jgi:hypothetical protein
MATPTLDDGFYVHTVLDASAGTPPPGCEFAVRGALPALADARPHAQRASQASDATRAEIRHWRGPLRETWIGGALAPAEQAV